LAAAEAAAIELAATVATERAASDTEALAVETAEAVDIAAA